MTAQTDWRELCRRLYVELFHCNQQMTSGKRPKWTAGKEVLASLADAKSALERTEQAAPDRAKVAPEYKAEVDQMVRDAKRYRWLVENAVIETAAFKHDGRDPCSTKQPLDNTIDAAIRARSAEASLSALARTCDDMGEKL